MSEYTALYRKYRPRIFSHVIGQDHITKVLRGEVASGAVSHAYLFCGSRGTGKTTCAKILAKSVNCDNPKNGDPCGECERCKSFDTSFDIIEMDAASNNGVDNIRELREKIAFLPIEMKRRVYIIDEVHMLSTGAFNALLKTLEEPPAHVMFILATTEFNKIPATIVSRCKRFDFHRISPDDMMPRLTEIAQKEEIGIDAKALRLIAFLATGAMRDALSMLELFVGQQSVDYETASKSLGVVGNAAIIELVRCIADKDSTNALDCIRRAYENSKDMSVVCSELGEMFRNLLVMKYASNKVSTLIDEGNDVIEALRNCEDKFTCEKLLYCTEIVEQTQNKLARNGLSRRTLMEIMIMRLCDARLSVSPESLLSRISELERNGVSINNVALPKSSAETKAKKDDKKAETETPESDVLDVPFELDKTQTELKATLQEPVLKQPREEKQVKPSKEKYQMIAFADVLEDVRQNDKMLYSMIVDSQAFLDEDVVTLKVNTMGMFMLSSNEVLKQTLTDTISKNLGYAVSLNLEVLEDKEGDNSKADLSGF